MTSLRSLLGFALIAMTAAACMPQTASAQPGFPQPVEVAGPPGGQMDPQDPYAPQAQQGEADPQQGPDGYQDPQQGQDPGYAQGPDGQDGAQMSVDVDAQAQVDPQDPSVAMGDVNDQEIDQTLDGQGSWSDVDGYGRVWRPDATVVGADFTPYETGGSWVDTDAGWAFNCDDYGWGWLPFHYGRWGWFDGYWGWQPGHRYASAWVDWRHGGGYVGWRPQGPIGHGGHQLPAHDSHWRFTSEGDFARPHVRAHLYGNLAEGLRVTGTSANPGLRNQGQVHASALMRNRASARQSWRGGGATGGNFRNEPNRGGNSGQSFRGQSAHDREQPTWQYRQPQNRAPQGYRQPSYAPPRSQSYRQGPAQPAYRQPAPPAYRQPAPRAQPSYRMPSSSYRAPAPSHSSSGGSHYSGGSSSHSSGGSSHSSGGGGGGGHSGGGRHR